MRKLLLALILSTPLLAQVPCVQITDKHLYGIGNTPMNGTITARTAYRMVNSSYTIPPSETRLTVVNGTLYGPTGAAGWCAPASAVVTAEYTTARTGTGTTGSTPYVATWTIPATGGPYAVKDLDGSNTTPTTTFPQTLVSPGPNSYILESNGGVANWVPCGGTTWTQATGTWSAASTPWNQLGVACLGSVAGVASFNTRTGTVSPANGDYTTDQVTEGGNLYFTSARVRALLSASSPLAYSSSTGVFSCPTCGAGAVASVYGRTGAVVATTGDYTAAQVTNAVDSTASYTNPAWIVSIPWSKISSPPALAANTGAVLHQFFTAYNSTTGAFSQAQPSCSDLSNASTGCAATLAPIATSGSATDLSAGTVAAARGGAGTVAGALKANGAGVVSQAACADLSNAAPSCSTDTTNASNLGSGTLPAARLPAHTGDATSSAGSAALTVSKINGVSMAGLATGIVKNTTGTGAPSIAVAADFPTFNQSTSGNAATATALAANGTNCGAGNYPLGVDAAGNAEGCTAAGGAVTTAGYYDPFGVIFNGTNQTGTGAYGANVVGCIDHVWRITDTPANINAMQYGTDTGIHMAWAIYSNAGNLLFQSSTYTGTAVGNATISLPWASPTQLSAGSNYGICFTSDSGGVAVLGYSSAYMPSIMNAGSIKYVYTATNPSTGTSTLLFPATTGARVANSGNIIAVVFTH